LGLATQELEGVQSMWESVTYRAIVAEEASKILMRQGSKLFGPPDKKTIAALERIKGISRLEGLILRLLEVSSWEELLAKPSRPRRDGICQKPNS